MNGFNRRRGFTLFALLVLFGIGGVLLAMFFPAVMKVREVSRRISCENNLKQIGLGVHNYESDHSRFPGTGTGDPDHQKEDAGSWCFRILPYLEQAGVYQQNGGKVPVATLYC